jgi:hypothetical protein
LQANIWQLHFHGPPSLLGEITHDLATDERLLRHQITKTPEVPKLKQWQLVRHYEKSAQETLVQLLLDEQADEMETLEERLDRLEKRKDELIDEYEAVKESQEDQGATRETIERRSRLLDEIEWIIDRQESLMGEHAERNEDWNIIQAEAEDANAMPEMRTLKEKLQEVSDELGGPMDRSLPSVVRAAQESREWNMIEEGAGDDRWEEHDGEEGAGDDEWEETDGEEGAGEDGWEETDGEEGAGDDEWVETDGEEGAGEDGREETDGEEGAGDDGREETGGEEGAGDDGREDTDGKNSANEDEDVSVDENFGRGLNGSIKEGSENERLGSKYGNEVQEEEGGIKEEVTMEKSNPVEGDSQESLVNRAATAEDDRKK